MKIDHIAIWTDSLEEMKEYYAKYFGGNAGEKYINSTTRFESYFLAFQGNTRLELMKKPGIPANLNDTYDKEYKGIIHIAFGMKNIEEVDGKAKELANDGFRILSGPRKTGDGFYEFVTLDPDGNRIEVIVKL